MRQLLVSAVTVVATAGQLLAQAYEAKPLTPAEAAADIAVLREALETIHPGYTRFASRAEMDASADQLEALAGGGTTDERLYLEVSGLLAQIRCDHTKAELPEAMVDFRQRVPSYLPVRTHLIGDHLYVGASAVAALTPGDEIVSINGMVTPEILRRVLPLIPIDGYTDFARADEFEASSEFLGSGLDHFLPLLEGWSESFVIGVMGADGKAREVEAPALTLGDWLALAGDGAVPEDFADAVSVERVGDDAAVLRVETFVNYRRPVDAMALFDEKMRELNESGVNRLVVDLRRNGGGSTDAAVALFVHLINGSVTLENRSAVRVLSIPDSVREHATTWDWSSMSVEGMGFTRWEQDENLWISPEPPVTLEPAPNAFRGRVTLLSSRGNASGSTMLIAALQKLASVRVVGEPTGGSVEGPTAGTLLFVKLPNSGITVRVPCVRTVTGLTPDETGMGVVPDVRIERTIETILSGRDMALDAALQD